METRVQVMAAIDSEALAAAIVARPDAAAIVRELLKHGSRLNEAAVKFVSEPTACQHVQFLAFSMVTWTEVVTRLGEGAGAPEISSEGLHEVSPRIASMIAPTMHACDLAHRAVHFAMNVWGAAGGEVAVADVTVQFEGKPVKPH